MAHLVANPGLGLLLSVLFLYSLFSIVASLLIWVWKKTK